MLPSNATKRRQPLEEIEDTDEGTDDSSIIIARITALAIRVDLRRTRPAQAALTGIMTLAPELGAEESELRGILLGAHRPDREAIVTRLVEYAEDTAAA